MSAFMRTRVCMRERRIQFEVYGQMKLLLRVVGLLPRVVDLLPRAEGLLPRAEDLHTTFMDCKSHTLTKIAARIYSSIGMLKRQDSS